MTRLGNLALRSAVIFFTLARCPAEARDPDPRVPNDLAENFDPLVAESVYDIDCDGARLPWRLPRFPDWDPNTLTVQEFCAKPQYGGRGPGKHLGGWCPNANFEEIGFDFLQGNPGVMKAQLFANPRSQSILAVHYTNARQEVKEWMAEEIGRYHDPLEHDTWVSLDKENEITCGGDFPDWPAPAPFEWSQWTSLQDLCAVQLSGGHFIANAGGYCHRATDGPRMVYFLDEMTPRPDWTWNNWRTSTAIRSYCRSHCRCSNPEREVRTPWIWKTSEGVQIRAALPKGDGSVTIQFQGPRGRTVEHIIPPYSPGGPQAPRAVGTCGSDGRRFCPEPWPTDRLGPTPAVTPYFPSPSPSAAATVDAPSAKQASVGQCAVPDTSGATSACGCSGCNSVSECSWSEFGACRCVARAIQKQGSGRDRFLGVCSQILSGPLGKIRRRDADGERGSGNESRSDARNDDEASGMIIDGTSVIQQAIGDADGTMAFLDSETEERLACPCNVSYVSFACCDSGDGVVFEPAALKLGSLS
ncbi:MAG: hypothetical protein M1817_000095 [Caeruleum heppii]|nr:MAG: hypothetical protein M1817_000095 [Caeruleum heppii]